MNEADNKNPDPLTTAAEVAWLEYVKGTWSETDRRIFMAGFNLGLNHLTEDYYTLAEIRLAAEMDVVEYGSSETRLSVIANLIDRKRPELRPYGQS